MRTIWLGVELTYDNDVMHGDDEEGWQFFLRDVLYGNGNLKLHCCEIGDIVGDIRVLAVAPQSWPPLSKEPKP